MVQKSFYTFVNILKLFSHSVFGWIVIEFLLIKVYMNKAEDFSSGVSLKKQDRLLNEDKTH